MTRTLILMRHAKSSWTIPGCPDHDRPLNTRGRRSTALLGPWMRQTGWAPDEVLCSTATRTQETLQGLQLNAPVSLLRDLYHADRHTMGQILANGKGACILMIAHNPGIAEFARNLVRNPPDHPRFYDYPTGATLVVRPDTGDVLDFVVPRDLMEKAG